jgi:Holliday junction resolvase RusA-like endonuclease
MLNLDLLDIYQVRQRGEIQLSFPIKPVSSGAGSTRQKPLIREIQKITSKCNFVFGGDVRIDIEWRIHEQQRYEFTLAPDLDNIAKPILDALSGPQGLLIDDCQVQSISCYWIDHFHSEEQEIIVTIRMMFQDDGIRKDKLFFVHIGEKLYYPISFSGIDSQNDLEVILEMLKNTKELMKIRDIYMKEFQVDYYSLKQIMPCQRLFHYQRVSKKFKSQLRELDILKDELLTPFKK